MEKKIKLFIDADDTILESSKAFIEILNERFNISPPKTYEDLKDWCYRSIYHFCTKDIINEIYDSDIFFEKVKINEIFKNFYNEHENDFEWFIVTKGHPKNIEQKKKYFRKHIYKIDTWSEIVNVLNASLKNPDIFMETERA